MKDIIELENTSDIQPGNTYSVKAYVFKIDSEGRPEVNAPEVFVFKMENGSFLKISSWEYDNADKMKALAKSKELCKVSFYAAEYKNTISLKLNDAEGTGEFEIPSTSGGQDYKSLIDQLIEQIKDPDYKTLVTALLIKDFYVWPAAKTIHHAYEGGLAEHTYGVTATAINEANLYANNKGMKINFDLVITGALLHDIGKIEEYTIDGEISELGKYLSHIVLGIEDIDRCCETHKLDKNSEKMILLKHVIASHHGKYEFGSPNLPAIPEAFIVSQADNCDAKMEIVAETLETMQQGDVTRPMGTLDGAKVFKR